jgi:O-antigen ligase
MRSPEDSLSSQWTLPVLGGFCVGSFTGIAIAQSALALGAFGLLLDGWIRYRRDPAALRQRHRPTLFPEGLVPVLTFYFAVQILAVVFSQHVSRSIGCFKGDLPVLFLPLLILLLLRTNRPSVPLWIFLGMGALSGIYGLWQFVFGLDLYDGQPLEALPGGGYIAVGGLGGHLTYGGLQLIATLMGAGLLLHGPGGRTRQVALLLTLACGVGVLASGARTAWLGTLAGLLVLLATLGWKRFALGAAVLVAGGLLFLSLPGVSARASGFLQLGDLPRIRLWETAVRIWQDFPLLGAGLGSFKTHFSAYKVPGLYDSTIHPHNDLLNVAVHSGAAGLLAFGSLWLWIFRSLRRWRPLTSMDRGVIRGALATAAGFLVAGLGQCYFTDEEPLTALWFAIALGLTAGWRASPGGQEPPKEEGVHGEARQALAPLIEGKASRPHEPAPSAGMRDAGDSSRG